MHREVNTFERKGNKKVSWTRLKVKVDLEHILQTHCFLHSRWKIYFVLKMQISNMYYICTTTRLITIVSKSDYHTPPIGGTEHYLITTTSSTPHLLRWYGVQYYLGVPIHSCMTDYPHKMASNTNAIPLIWAYLLI